MQRTIMQEQNMCGDGWGQAYEEVCRWPAPEGGMRYEVPLGQTSLQGSVPFAALLPPPVRPFPLRDHNTRHVRAKIILALASGWLS